MIIIAEKKRPLALAIKGLRTACEETKFLTGEYGDSYLQIDFDTANGQIITYELKDSSNIEKIPPSRPSVIFICYAFTYMSMNQIANEISKAVECRRKRQTAEYLQFIKNQ